MTRVILAGFMAAYLQNSWIDTTVMSAALVGVSVPSFWLSVMGILLFSVLLGWLPTSGYVPPGEGILACIRSLTLPALSLAVFRSEEHTSELQSLMRISYAVFCLKKKKKQKTTY